MAFFSFNITQRIALKVCSRLDCEIPVTIKGHFTSCHSANLDPKAHHCLSLLFILGSAFQAGPSNKQMCAGARPGTVPGPLSLPDVLAVQHLHSALSALCRQSGRGPGLGEDISLECLLPCV
jgi:hypothetical protein